MGQSLLLQTVDTRKNSFVILRNKDLELNRKKWIVLLEFEWHLEKLNQTLK